MIRLNASKCSKNATIMYKRLILNTVLRMIALYSLTIFGKILKVAGAVRLERLELDLPVFLAEVRVSLEKKNKDPYSGMKLPRKLLN